jgi:Ca2+-transporting ATPase
MKRHTIKGKIIPTKIFNKQETLRLDPKAEADFEIENNKFAFSPGQLGRLYNPQILNAFHALGRLNELEKGL